MFADYNINNSNSNNNSNNNNGTNYYSVNEGDNINIIYTLEESDILFNYVTSIL